MVMLVPEKFTGKKKRKNYVCSIVQNTKWLNNSKYQVDKQETEINHVYFYAVPKGSKKMFLIHLDFSYFLILVKY